MQAASECRIHSHLLQKWTNQMDANQGVGHSQKSLYTHSQPITMRSGFWRIEKNFGDGVLFRRPGFWKAPQYAAGFFFLLFVDLISCLAFRVADLVWKVFVHCHGSWKDDNRSAGQDIPPSPQFFKCEMLFTATLIFSETHQSKPHRHSLFSKDSF